MTVALGYFAGTVGDDLGGRLHDKTHARLDLPGWHGPDLLGLLSTLSLTAPVLTFASYMLVAIPIGLGMVTFMSVNNAVIMSAVPGNLRGFASAMLETTRQEGHMFAVPLLSSMITLQSPAWTLTALADPALDLTAFHINGCMVVGCIAPIALAFAFVLGGPEAGGKFRCATPAGLADS